LNVLSLFDGISCGQEALKRADMKIEKYFASEIDKPAIKITQKNYPNTIQIGDVTKVKGSDLPEIDLLMGGSPCQGFSIAGKQLDFNDPRSALFFEYVRLLKETKPEYFILENVKMKQWCQDIISEYLGVQPIEINSALVSAQNRKRLYWTNIPNVQQPKDKNIMLCDILENQVDEKYYINTETAIQICDNEFKRRKIGYISTDSDANRIYSIHGKSVTLKAL
jgi:site-specific DNA-cytosine methylase